MDPESSRSKQKTGEEGPRVTANQRLLEKIRRQREESFRGGEWDLQTLCYSSAMYEYAENSTDRCLTDLLRCLGGKL